MEESERDQERERDKGAAAAGDCKLSYRQTHKPSKETKHHKNTQTKVAIWIFVQILRRRDNKPRSAVWQGNFFAFSKERN